MSYSYAYNLYCIFTYTISIISTPYWGSLTCRTSAFSISPGCSLFSLTQTSDDTCNIFLQRSFRACKSFTDRSEEDSTPTLPCRSPLPLASTLFSEAISTNLWTFGFIRHESDCRPLFNSPLTLRGHVLNNLSWLMVKRRHHSSIWDSQHSKIIFKYLLWIFYLNSLSLSLGL